MCASYGGYVELFDFADARLGTQAACDYPSITGYAVANLLSKHRSAQSPASHAVHAQLSLFDTRTGFLAESFVKPPVEVTFTFAFPVSLAAAVVNPRVRMHTAKHVSLFVMSGRGQRWEYVSRLEWTDGHATPLRGAHNQELGAQTVARVAARCGSAGAGTPIAWAPMERAPASLHNVAAVKLRIASMHNAGALGIGGIELWAQPSQRLPRAQRDNAWHRVRQAVGTGGAPQPAPAPPHADIYEHPPPDCPPEFVDSVTHCLMRDPVFLPSTARCDRSTIDRHLREHSTDPFTGLPLDASQVKPDLVLQQR
ncbi:RING finger protein 37, partial [Coemansia nantahalensis]